MCNILYTFVPSPDSFLNLLCTEIIFHQEEEIEYMVSWLQARNRTAGTPCSAITSTDNTMMPGMMPAAAPTAMTMPGMTPAAAPTGSMPGMMPAAAPTTMHMPAAAPTTPPALSCAELKGAWNAAGCCVHTLDAAAGNGNTCGGLQQLYRAGCSCPSAP